MPSDRWGEISGLIDRCATSGSLPQGICQAGNELLGAESSALTLSVDEGLLLIASSSDLAAQVVERQIILGEGPTIEAQEAMDPLVISSLRDAEIITRWPGFSKAARELKVQAAIAFPLRVGEIRVGVLTLVRSHVGVFSDVEYDDGLILVAVATEILLEHQASIEVDAVAEIFTRGLSSTAQVQQAAGMVSEQLGISVTRALALLRAHSYSEDLPLSRVALLVLSRELRLEH